MIYLNFLVKDELLDDSLKEILRTTSQKIIGEEERESEELSITLSDDMLLRELNLKYRQKDSATDVLSFPLKEDHLLGDIIISIEMVKRNAKEFGVTFKEEILRLLIHGILHLLGHEHGEKMFQKQEILLKEALA